MTATTSDGSVAAPRFHADRPPTCAGTSLPPARLHHPGAAKGLEALAADLPVGGGRVLDYGCADMPYRRFFAPDVEYLAADLPGNPHARDRDRCPTARCPSADASVRRRCSRPRCSSTSPIRASTWRSARACCGPAGGMLLSTHGIMVYHPDPVDYWRWTCAGCGSVVARRRASRSCGSRGSWAWPRPGSSSFQDAWCWRAAAAAAAARSRSVMQTLIALGRPLPEPPRAASSTRWSSRSWRRSHERASGASGARTRYRQRRNLAGPGCCARSPTPTRTRSSSRSAPTTASSTTTCARFILVAALAGDHGRARAVRVRAPATQLRAAATADRAGERRDRRQRRRAALLPPARSATPERARELPDWYDGIGSFSRDAVLGHAAHIPDIESRIVSSEVPALTFESLCRKQPRRRGSTSC